jgi:hypothetical protein
MWIDNWIYRTLLQLLITNHYHRPMFSVTLPGSGSKKYSVLGFQVQRLLSSLVGTRKTKTGGSIILKWILEGQDVVVWAELIDLRIGPGGGLL